MSSLAEELRSRHLESGGRSEESASYVSQVTSESGSSAASGLTTATDAKHSRQSPDILSIQGASSSQSSLFADLPQLKSAGSSTGSLSSQASPLSSWGSAVNRAATASTTVPSAVGSTPFQNGASGPKIPKGNLTVLTVTLEVPDEKAKIFDAVRTVSGEYGVKIEIAKSSTPNHATFMIKGAPPAKISAAKEELEATFQPQETLEFEIPSSSRAVVIGQRGTTLRGLESKFKVSIELSSLKSSSSSWSLERTLVAVSGRSSSVKSARAAIMELIDPQRRTSSSRKIPLECAPIVKQDARWGPLVDTNKNRITLNGPFTQILNEMLEFDAFLGCIESRFVRKAFTSGSSSSQSANIPESIIRKILEAHSTVVFPNSNELYGPPESVDAAVAILKDFIKTQVFTQLDIAQAHGRDVSHARMLARYLAAKGEIARIAAESDGTVDISLDPIIDERSVVYTFSGTEKAVSKARASLKKIVNEHSPSSIAVIRGMRHPLVRKRAESNLRTLEGPITGFIGPSDELYLEYCEPEDDFALSEDEIRKHIKLAQEALAPLTEFANSLTKKKVAISESDARLILEPRGPEATALWKEYIGTKDIELELVLSQEGEADESKALLILDGSRDAVTEAAEKLPKIAQLSRQYAVLSSHVEELVIDPKLVRNLIGKGGSQIQKFRDEFDAKIEVDEAGHVRIQAVEAQAKACSKTIAEFQRRLRDEVTENLAIPVEFHAKLIGPRGKHVRRLSEQYQCVIKFPKTRQGSVESSFSEATHSTANGSETNSAESEARDGEIFIRGPSRGVAAIKREFLDLVNYEKAQSYTEEMSVPGSVVSRLVGRGGVAINLIRQSTGTQIDVGTANSNDEDVKVVVTGEPKSVKAAMAQLQKSAEAAIDFSEKYLEVPQEYHRFLTGPQNSVRRRLVAEAGGDEENANRILAIPPQNSARNQSQIRLSGPSSVVTNLESQILKIIEDAKRRSKEEGTLEVSRNRLRHIVGAEGQTRKQAEETYDVYIDIPRSNGSEDGRVSISVRGETKDSVTKAIDYLRELALPSELVIDIAEAGWSQRLRSQVNSKFKVRVDPVQPSNWNSHQSLVKPKNSNFIILSRNDAPYNIKLRILAKTAEECQKAAEFIVQSTNLDTVGYLWLEEKQIPAVVGTGGKTVNKIRADTGCTIDVPNSSRNAPITIAGSKSGVDAAIPALIQAASISK